MSPRADSERASQGPPYPKIYVGRGGPEERNERGGGHLSRRADSERGGEQ